MKLSLNYPVTRASSTAEEEIFYKVKTNQQIENTKNATIIGCLAFFAYLFVFLTVYGTARSTGNIFFIPQLTPPTNPKEIKGFTMSEAFQYCNKEMSTIVIIVFFSLLYNARKYSLINLLPE